MISLDCPKSKTGVPILKKEDIDNYAMKFLADFDKSLINSVKPVPIEDIIEQYLNLEIDYQYLSQDESILGLTAFTDGYANIFNPDTGKEQAINVSKGTIILENSLTQDKGLEGRLRFTGAHEASHWILHRDRYMVDKNQGSLFSKNAEAATIRCLNRNIENERVFGFTNGKSTTDDDWLEWQADYAASAILMPKTPFLAAFLAILKDYGIRQPYLYVDDQKVNVITYKSVTNMLSNLFNVSKKAAHIRLAKFNCIKQGRKQRDFAQLFADEF